MLLLVPEFDRDLQSLHDRISMKVPRKSLKSLINPFFSIQLSHLEWNGGGGWVGKVCNKSDMNYLANLQ